MDITFKQHANVIADLDIYTKTDGSQATTRTDQRNLLNALIKAWSDTSTMLTTATGAYAGHPLTVSFQGITTDTPEYQAWLDKLTILEHFNGRTFPVVPAGTEAVTVNGAGGGKVQRRQNRMLHPELRRLGGMPEPAYRLAA